MTPIDIDLELVTGGNASYPVRMTAAEADTRLKQIQQNFKNAGQGSSSGVIHNPTMFMMGPGGAVTPVTQR